MPAYLPDAYDNNDVNDNKDDEYNDLDDDDDITAEDFPKPKDSVGDNIKNDKKLPPLESLNPDTEKGKRTKGGAIVGSYRRAKLKQNEIDKLYKMMLECKTDAEIREEIGFSQVSLWKWKKKLGKIAEAELGIDKEGIHIHIRTFEDRLKNAAKFYEEISRDKDNESTYVRMEAKRMAVYLYHALFKVRAESSKFLYEIVRTNTSAAVDGGKNSEDPVTHIFTADEQQKIEQSEHFKELKAKWEQEAREKEAVDKRKKKGEWVVAEAAESETTE